MQLSIYFLHKVSGADITMKDFSTFLCMRRYKNWAHKIVPWKYLIIWRPVLPVFSRAQRASSVLFILGTPFRGNWRSAAHNLILVEVDGKCQFVGDRIHLTKYVLDLYPENDKILMKEMNTNSWIGRFGTIRMSVPLKMLWRIHRSAIWNTCSFFCFFFFWEIELLLKFTWVCKKREKIQGN